MQTKIRFKYQQFKILTSYLFVPIVIFMKRWEQDSIYRAFGNLVRLHRKRTPGMTQQKLGDLVGLSRTSITNIEKGRQHVSLHQLLGLAEALRISPYALLPSPPQGQADSWLADKLPPGTDPEITEWADKIVSRRTEMESK
ncbi:helix-turn-helix domain-containing protein [Lentisalinibacter salinarum]|uniref:helix-turn-helix domain-containing protein n=1 Tax=Lentisalinibacter salinarum TaxID=2992239 RepID=UPI00386448DB